MNDIDFFLELPFTAQLAAMGFVVFATCLLVIILTAPRRDCLSPLVPGNQARCLAGLAGNCHCLARRAL